MKFPEGVRDVRINRYPCGVKELGGGQLTLVTYLESETR
jgi:hypothetical protein